jgi:hypothetical protein
MSYGFDVDLLMLLGPNGLASEPYASLGIDFQAMGGAPNRKRIGIDINFLEGLPITPELIQQTLSSLKPIIISCGKAISVNE